MLPKRKTADVVTLLSNASDPVDNSGGRDDPLAELRALQKAVDTARRAASDAADKLREHEEALADKHRIVAGALAATNTLADLEGRYIVAPGSVPLDEIDSARVAAESARANATAARPRIAALERAVAITRDDQAAKAAHASDAQRELDTAIVGYLRECEQAAFARFDAAHAEMTAAVAQWNGIDQLVDRIKPPLHEKMVFTGSNGFRFADMPSGPDANPFRGASRAFPDNLIGKHAVLVKPSAIEAEKHQIRSALATAGIQL